MEINYKFGSFEIAESIVYYYFIFVDHDVRTRMVYLVDFS